MRIPGPLSPEGGEEPRETTPPSKVGRLNQRRAQAHAASRGQWGLSQWQDTGLPEAGARGRRPGRGAAPRASASRPHGSVRTGVPTHGGSCLPPAPSCWGGPRPGRSAGHVLQRTRRFPGACELDAPQERAGPACPEPPPRVGVTSASLTDLTGPPGTCRSRRHPDPLGASRCGLGAASSSRTEPGRGGPRDVGSRPPTGRHRHRCTWAGRPGGAQPPPGRPLSASPLPPFLPPEKRALACAFHCLATERAVRAERSPTEAA